MCCSAGVPGVLDFTLVRADPAPWRRHVAGPPPAPSAPIRVAVRIHRLGAWRPIFASRRDLNVLRGVVDGMVRADPRLRREAITSGLRSASLRIQAWRADGERRRRGLPRRFGCL